jgi:hypothetical protein
VAQAWRQSNSAKCVVSRMNGLIQPNRQAGTGKAGAARTPKGKERGTSERQRGLYSSLSLLFRLSCCARVLSFCVLCLPLSPGACPPPLPPPPVHLEEAASPRNGRALSSPLCVALPLLPLLLLFYAVRRAVLCAVLVGWDGRCARLGLAHRPTERPQNDP